MAPPRFVPPRKSPAVPAPALPPRPLLQKKAVPRVYPLLNPRAQVDVDRSQIGTLRPFFGDYRVSQPNQRGQVLPNTRYVFVTDTSGSLRVHPRYRHPVLAEGKPVLYAGEAEFRHGKLEWWSNSSGNYKPDRLHAEQAGLPMERFYTHEQVRSGAHRKKAVKAEAE